MAAISVIRHQAQAQVSIVATAKAATDRMLGHAETAIAGFPRPAGADRADRPSSPCRRFATARPGGGRLFGRAVARDAAASPRPARGTPASKGQGTARPAPYARQARLSRRQVRGFGAFTRPGRASQAAWARQGRTGSPPDRPRPAPDPPAPSPATSWTARSPPFGSGKARSSPAARASRAPQAFAGRRRKGQIAAASRISKRRGSSATRVPAHRPGSAGWPGNGPPWPAWARRWRRCSAARSATARAAASRRGKARPHASTPQAPARCRP